MNYRFDPIAQDLGNHTHVDIGRDASLDAMRRLAAEEERWIWKAMARGVGNRVWRSNGIVEGTTMHYRFAILEPGDPVPGSGIVFGPLSASPSE